MNPLGRRNLNFLFATIRWLLSLITLEFLIEVLFGIVDCLQQLRCFQIGHLWGRHDTAELLVGVQTYVPVDVARVRGLN